MLVSLAFALRLIPVVFVPSLNWADEIFQTTEQAHRLVYGTGLIPWEFQLHIRSWLLPGVIAGLLEFARVFGDGPRYYLPVIAGGFGVLATVPVVCCFLWCRRWFGLPAAFVAGLCVAVAPELIYMGDRTLSEVVAGHLLVLGLYILAPGYRVGSAARLFWAGIVLGFVFVLRMQLAPALALIALWSTINRGWRDLRWVVAGGCAVLALAGLLDWITLGAPFASIWRYALYNVYYGISSTFGVEPWYFYAFAELAIWGSGLAVVLVLAMLGTRRTGLPLAVALVIVASHSLIGHKEYRFIYPAIVLLTVQAGIGLAALVDAARRRLGGFGCRQILARAVPLLAALSWCALALAIWRSPVMAALRYRAHDNLVAMSFAAQNATICGVGLYGENAWTWYGGYTYLHRAVPMYWPEDESRLRDTASGFDVLLYSIANRAGEPGAPLGFAKVRCFGKVCLARRPGRCEPVHPMPMPVPAPLAELPQSRDLAE